MIHLANPTKHPPGGYYYEQGGAIPHTFPAIGGIRLLATQVSDFRVANKLPRSSWEEAYADIEAFTCARLGVGAWCSDSEATYSPPQRIRASGGCCGAKIA